MQVRSDRHLPSAVNEMQVEDFVMVWWKKRLHGKLPACVSWRPVPFFAQLSAGVTFWARLPAVTSGLDWVPIALPQLCSSFLCSSLPGEWCLCWRRDSAVILILCACCKWSTRFWGHTGRLLICVLYFLPIFGPKKQMAARDHMLADTSLLLATYYFCQLQLSVCLLYLNASSLAGENATFLFAFSTKDTLILLLLVVTPDTITGAWGL